MSLLASIALKVGAPIVASILKTRLGAGGQIAGGVVEEIAGRLGTPPSEEAIAEKFESEPAAVETIIRQVDEDMAKIAQAASQAAMSYHRLAEGDRDSQSLLTRAWRPFTAILFPVACMMIVITTCAILYQQIPVGADAYPVVAIIVPLMTLWAGVVGYYVGQRTKEKIEA